MRIVKPAERPTASDAEQSDLIDVLHDVVDEFDAGNCDLSTFAFEVAAMMMALDVVADPAWLAALGEEWLKLRVLRAEQRQAGTFGPSRAQGVEGQAIADRIRKLIASSDDSATRADAANL